MLSRPFLANNYSSSLSSTNHDKENNLTRSLPSFLDLHVTESTDHFQHLDSATDPRRGRRGACKAEMHHSAQQSLQATALLLEVSKREDLMLTRGVSVSVTPS